jgi:hypothetical protein
MLSQFVPEVDFAISTCISPLLTITIGHRNASFHALNPEINKLHPENETESNFNANKVASIAQ